MGTPRNDDLPKWRIAAYALSRCPHARSALTSAPILHLKDGQISANVCVGKNKAKTGPGRSNPAVLKDQISANRAERLSRGLYGQDSGHGTEPFNGTGFDQGLTGGRR
jgi:hypothetical protein